MISCLSSWIILRILNEVYRWSMIGFTSNVYTLVSIFKETERAYVGLSLCELVVKGHVSFKNLLGLNIGTQLKYDTVLQKELSYLSISVLYINSQIRWCKLRIYFKISVDSNSNLGGVRSHFMKWPKIPPKTQKSVHGKKCIS